MIGVFPVPIWNTIVLEVVAIQSTCRRLHKEHQNNRKIEYWRGKGVGERLVVDIYIWLSFS